MPPGGLLQVGAGAGAGAAGAGVVLQQGVPGDPLEVPAQEVVRPLRGDAAVGPRPGTCGHQGHQHGGAHRGGQGRGQPHQGGVPVDDLGHESVGGTDPGAGQQVAGTRAGGVLQFVQKQELDAFIFISFSSWKRSQGCSYCCCNLHEQRHC